MTPLPRAAAIVLTVAATTLVATAQTDAHAVSPSGGSRAAAPHTRLHVHVTGCDRCSVTLQHAVTGRPHVWTSRTRRIGSDHVAVFTVRSSRTHGMSFVLHAPWQGATGAVPNVVTRYAGHTIDSFVSRSAARNAVRAEGCWAGTNVDDVRLDFHVARVEARTLSGQPTAVPLVYATHSMSSWRPMVKAFKGTIGNQDAFYCVKPLTAKVTFTASRCEGCEITVMNGATRAENVWSADPEPVTNGRVTFHIPRPATRGISATVVAPWEGATGHTTLLAFRYAGHQVGDPVSFQDARSRRHASPCWGGTSERDLTLPVTVRKVTVAGSTGPTAGTIAYADVTQSWLTPMMRASRGVIGSQEVITCSR